MPGWDPLRDLISLQERMNRLFEESLHKPRSSEEGLTVGTWSPPVDIFETQDEIVLKAELADVSQEDIQINVEDNHLIIRGERKLDEKIKREQFHRIERSYGPFVRSFTLPHTIDQEGIRAEYRNGVLKVTMPKRVEEKSKQIKIKVE